ncbi:hypothetical protein GWK47_017674 [Chionoecetes opilio]|uniref:Uncharacterized protein n=1 Tax=Chionoecetes opilio TaxID=41210 RepID=A0A8J4XR50_CHIOP|nr:hypothetical protein GWK47_017674 [Chionoecetes opilio]
MRSSKMASPIRFSERYQRWRAWHVPRPTRPIVVDPLHVSDEVQVVIGFVGRNHCLIPSISLDHGHKERNRRTPGQTPPCLSSWSGKSDVTGRWPWPPIGHVRVFRNSLPVPRRPGNPKIPPSPPGHKRAHPLPQDLLSLDGGKLPVPIGPKGTQVKERDWQSLPVLDSGPGDRQTEHSDMFVSGPGLIARGVGVSQHGGQIVPPKKGARPLGEFILLRRSTAGEFSWVGALKWS